MAQGPIYDQPQGPTQMETAAVALSVVWVVVIALAFWLFAGDAAGGLRHVVMLLVMGVPVGLAGVALAAARSMRVMQVEIYQLKRAVDALRQPVAAASQAVPVAAQPPAALRPAHTAKPAPLARAQTIEQPALALGSLPDDDKPPLDRPDLILALNFPDSEDDAAGFGALRRALRDRTARHLVQASQDVLTLLSQDGIYMDDLRPQTPDADIWRRFAKGERGQAVASVGAVREQAALDIVIARMREDTVFRDAVHHFLRRFDLILAGFEEQASDTDMMALAETRTARAFMLLGRASRIFD